MNITKDQLRNYVADKFNTRKLKLENEIDEYLFPLQELVNKTYQQGIEMEKQAVSFYKKFESTLKHYGIDNTWRETSLLRELNRAAYGWTENKQKALLIDIKSAIRYPSNYTLDFLDVHGVELKSTVEKLQKEMVPLYKLVDDLLTLENEVEHVIKKEKTANSALKTLIALGIDMSDFEEKKKLNQLPSVLKFSVDTCILNGGCN